MVNKQYKLFVDDERWPVDPDWVIARSPMQAQMAIEHYGMPVCMCLDHDLGTDGNRALTTMEFLHWLEARIVDGTYEFPEGFSYFVHSQNPVGVRNIKGLLDNLMAKYGLLPSTFLRK